MEKQQRSKLQTATQDARKLLEEEFRSQLLQAYDIDVEKVRWAEEPGAHLQAEQRLIREKLVAWIEHKEAQIHDRKEALLLALREMAFTALNRFVALKLMEARELVRPCVSGGLESAGFLEFTAVAQGLLADQESSYRLYLETIFEDVSRELRALFDPRDPASLLWPKRAALLELLDILNRPELAELWIEDETLGWVYQYFNGDAERKKMREESSAPRNSRELAVRNQFFTPRYVVEFLTDNTLGRIWYEMRQGNTGLKDQCRYLVRRPNELWLQPGVKPPVQPNNDEALNQEELLHQPVHIPYRPLKDPREIRMLDPACGSMHFGLYAFDLFTFIYNEAWDIAHGLDDAAKTAETFAKFVTFAASFSSKTAFLHNVPRLILEHNIHGIDIDPRAAQIAGLSLWLRAQRAWHQAGVISAERLRISRSNVVCAEPMPGEKQLLGDFLEQQFPAEERPAFAFLLEKIFERMSLAGEAGSLLCIEEEICSAIAEARALAKSQSAPRQTALFPGIEQPEQAELDLGGLDDEQFWQAAERRIYEALEAYAEQADKSSGLQRRLFADDAAQGIAFINLCRKLYDVVVMNPPFGSFPTFWAMQSKISYPNSSNDILGAFVERGIDLLAEHGRLGAITARTAFFLSSFKKWREELILKVAPPMVFADLGYGVMDDAVVEAAAYCLQKGYPEEEALLATFLRVLEELEDKNAALLRALDSPNLDRSSQRFVSDPKRFFLVPGSPFAYWISDRIRLIYKTLPNFEKCGCFPKMGLTTNSDFRFLRLSWETTPNDPEVKAFAKGGAYSPFYGDVYLRIRWQRDGKELKAFALTTPGTTHWSRNIRSPDFYLRPGITWSRRTKTELSMRAMPANCIFSDKGPAAFVHEDNSTALLTLLSIVNSKVFRSLLAVQLAAADAKAGGAARSYEVGLIQETPLPDVDDAMRKDLSRLGKLSWRAKRSLDASENSQAFVLPAALRVEGGSLSQRASTYTHFAANVAAQLFQLQAEIDELCFNAYGITGLDREYIERSFAKSVDNEGLTHDSEEEEEGISVLRVC